MKVTTADVDALARTVYGEARGESHRGRCAVAHVVLNRVAAQTWYGGTVEEVCRKPRQFSCWNESDPNRAKLLAVDLGDPAYRCCMLAALAALTGLESDPTEGATHYCRADVEPAWAVGRPYLSIGAHRFYGGVD